MDRNGKGQNKFSSFIALTLIEIKEAKFDEFVKSTICSLREHFWDSD
jgi:hypothetical protein